MPKSYHLYQLNILQLKVTRLNHSAARRAFKNLYDLFFDQVALEVKTMFLFENVISTDRGKNRNIHIYLQIRPF